MSQRLWQHPKLKEVVQRQLAVFLVQETVDKEKYLPDNQKW